MDPRHHPGMTECSWEEEESPASPPSFEKEVDRTRTTATRVRVELDESEGVGFSLDCEGQEEEPSDGRCDDFDRRSGGSGPFREGYQRQGSRQDQGYFDRGRGYPQNSQSMPMTGPGGTWRRAPQDEQPSSSWQGGGGGSQQGLDYARRGSGHLYDIDSGISMLSGGISARAVGDGKGSQQDQIPPPSRPKNSCWNCKGDHMITECPDPKEPRRIAANRKIFMAAKNQSTPFGGQIKRYHSEGTTRNFRPGELSAELRVAMGIGPIEVPLHVYRMRIFGYPPGWLENAMSEASSGLKLYGDTITRPMGNMDKVAKINPDNIIEYPGFNAPIPFGQLDDYETYYCPRWKIDDSKDNMLRSLNAQNLLSEGDGIVSQTVDVEPDWDSLKGLDRPMLNDAAKHGIGRGRHVHEDTLPIHLQPGRGRGAGPARKRPLSPVYPPQRIDRETRSRIIERAPIIPLDKDIDARYLPTPSHAHRNRRNSRTPSPSLLGSYVNSDTTTVPTRIIPTERSSSPVIVNMPSGADKERKRASDADSVRSGGTGSTSEFLTAPRRKRRKTSDKAADSASDDVMILPNDEEIRKAIPHTSADEDSDCLVIDTEIEPSPMKRAVTPKKVSQTTSTSKPKRPQPPEVVQLDSMDSEDWNKIRQKKVVRKPFSKRAMQPASPGSATGDEADFIDDNGSNSPGAFVQSFSKPSITATFDEDWEEAGSNGSDKLVIDEEDLENPGHSGASTRRKDKPDVPKLNAEFILPNPDKAAIQSVLLAHFEEPDENTKSFHTLPDVDKFKVGLPEMVFEEDTSQKTGRLDKVLKVLKSRRGNNVNEKSDTTSVEK